MGAAAVVVGGVDAFVVEPRWLDVTEHELVVEGLPAALEGFAIAQITDAHLTTLGQVESSVLRQIRARSPQVVVLTGDLIDSLAHGPALAELCAELSRTGAEVIATLGNWEHWGHIPRTRLSELYRGSGASLLVDRWQPTDGGVALYGTDDSTAGAPGDVSAGEAAAVRVLLTHSPAYADAVNVGERPFDLILAGHTHGGQVTVGVAAPVVPPGSGRFVAGWYETPAGMLYVNRGLGTSIVPARLMCRPELSITVLTRA